ncbi:MAG: sensor histidine kinase [Myxococcales bacterium]
MRLSEFIHHHRTKIVQEWVRFARTLRPWSEGMSDKALRDHAEALLAAVVIDMESPQTSSQKSEKSKGHVPGGTLSSVGQKHATDRLETGFKLDQLVSEYRALRASVVGLWAEAHGDKQGELTRFNEAIDESLAEAAVRYSDLMNHTREQFLAILGHDLRNPLAAITVGATLLTKAETIDDRQARVATRILNSAVRMTRMIGYLLDLARTRLGSSIPLTRTRTDLAPVCEQVIAELGIVYPDCQLRFESTGDLVGEWDGDRLTQVISNLVANALQHGEDPVDLVARGQGDEVVVQVHNGGPPMSEIALKRAFEPMVRRATQSGNKNASGLGLGLYIAREVLAAHGGTIGVISTEAEGTTFTVRIPRRPSGTRADGSPRKKARKGEQQPAAERFRSQDRRSGDRRRSSPRRPS